MATSERDRRRANRFWSRVDKSGGEAACWEWTGSKIPSGYGTISWDGKKKYVHRLAWELTYDHPGDLHVCHSCDNPSCVNPAHLWLGTHQDNVRDRDRKGRGRGTENLKNRTRSSVPRGENHCRAKLTAKQVLEIRRRHVPYKVTCQMLADEYGVTASNIGDIISRASWKSLPPEIEVAS